MDFNQEINTLPKSLIKLNFGVFFNRQLGNLLKNLDNLQELEFGYNFNQQILENTLPKSLIKLKFGQNFNNGVGFSKVEPLGDALFNLKNLQDLEFGNSFNQQILKNTLPESLIKLKFGEYFNNYRKELDDAFTNLIILQELEFGKRFNQEIINNNLTKNLKKLIFGLRYSNN